MKQRVEELEQLHKTASAAIQARSASLAEAQRLVAKYEYIMHSANKALNDLKENPLMKRKEIDLDLVSRAAEHRRHLQVTTFTISPSSFCLIDFILFVYLYVSVCLFLCVPVCLSISLSEMLTRNNVTQGSPFSVQVFIVLCDSQQLF